MKVILFIFALVFLVFSEEKTCEIHKKKKCWHTEVREKIEELRQLDIDLYNTDFFLTWDKTLDEVKAHLLVSDILRIFREHNVSPKIFDSGLAISLFRDQSTRTRFSFSSAANFLGLTVSDFDEAKSQVKHGETLVETANMISFMTDIIGIRDDMYIGKGHTYMKDFSESVQMGYEKGVLEQRPTLVNLQCDIDHPTQSMSDLNHLAHHFGGLENLKGKKIVMSWAYSPSYGKPLSVPQGVIGLMTRFGMDVVLAHPKGYDLMDETLEVARKNAKESGGSFTLTHDMKEAFKNADIVYPKSWASFKAMEERTKLKGDADKAGILPGKYQPIKDLEKKLLKENAKHKDWECTEDLMKLTKEGKALYMHCLPADITDVSCKEGEVANSVFQRYKIDTYKEAGYKPYIISSMMFLQKVKYPADKLNTILERSIRRLN